MTWKIYTITSSRTICRVRRTTSSNRLKRPFTSLSETPERGTYPKELLAIGIREYREIFFKPYRIIYRVIAENIYILLIADGRRDMQGLLQRRLLQA